jgi:Ni/Co efflux regulator RcnB
MKRLLLSASITLMLLSSAAFAAPRHGGHDDRGAAWSHDRRNDSDRGDHDRDRNDSNRRPAWHDQHDGRWSDRRYYSDDNGRWSDRRYYSDHDNGRHNGYYREDFRRGARMPVVYMQPRYYVNDWRDYRLAPPPRGYMWVRPPDGRFLLVAAATGLIAEILGGY